MRKGVNLLPWREELKELQKKQFFAMLGTGIIISVVIIILMHFFVVQYIAYQVKRNDFLQQQISLVDKQISEIQRLQKEKELLLARMNIIQHLQENRPHVVKLFDGLVRTIPEGLYLTSMTRLDMRLTMEGKAESNTKVSKLMRNIETSHWLTAPELSTIQAENPKNGEHEITFHLQAQQLIN